MISAIGSLAYSKGTTAYQNGAAVNLSPNTHSKHDSDAIVGTPTSHFSAG